jgi:hypothetical protein
MQIKVPHSLLLLPTILVAMSSRLGTHILNILLRMPSCIESTFLLHLKTPPHLSYHSSISSPKNKSCPTLLKPWTDFPIRQQQLFERVRKYIPRDAQQFTELGQDLCNRPLASEKDLEAYQRVAVERPTTNIISQLQKIEDARRELNLSDGIMFENHSNTLADSTKEVQQSLQNLRLSKRQALARKQKTLIRSVSTRRRMVGAASV